jgi:hypothetical protein
LRTPPKVALVTLKDRQLRLDLGHFGSDARAQLVVVQRRGIAVCIGQIGRGSGCRLGNEEFAQFELLFFADTTTT